jgi:hypothetical protein
MTTSLPKPPAAEAEHSLPMYVALIPWLLFNAVVEEKTA